MQELIVKQKAEELLYRVYPRLVNFPKAEKFALCARIKEAFFDVIKFIYLGNSVKSKRKVYLQEADGHLQALKVLMKLSRERRYISKGFFCEIDTCITEINRMLSGYIRHAAKVSV
jgi:four helix bundle protein